MKKVLKLWQTLKAEIEAALTPAEKRTICEDAKLLANAILNGVWLELALLLIGDIEKTIPATAA